MAAEGRDYGEIRYTPVPAKRAQDRPIAADLPAARAPASTIFRFHDLDGDTAAQEPRGEPIG